MSNKAQLHANVLLRAYSFAWPLFNVLSVKVAFHLRNIHCIQVQQGRDVCCRSVFRDGHHSHLDVYLAYAHLQKRLVLQAEN